jgi:hypothetical protein
VRILILLVLAGSLGSVIICSATADVSSASETSESDGATSTSANAEAPRRRLVDWNQYESPWFSLRIGGVVMGDVAGYSQDAASVSQVGTLNTQTQLRNFRLTVQLPLHQRQRRPRGLPG